MNTSRHALACAALLAALGGTALAQSPTPSTPPAPQAGRSGHEHGHDHGHGMKHAGRGEHRFEQHMADLKSKLQLLPEQEGAWAQFEQAMRPAAPPQRPDREAMMKLPTPERMDRMHAMRQQHMARMDQRAEATKTFYAALTPEQKKRFDERTARMMERHGPSRHSGHHSHHG